LGNRGALQKQVNGVGSQDAAFADAEDHPVGICPVRANVQLQLELCWVRVLTFDVIGVEQSGREASGGIIDFCKAYCKGIDKEVEQEGGEEGALEEASPNWDGMGADPVNHHSSRHVVKEQAVDKTHCPGREATPGEYLLQVQVRDIVVGTRDVQKGLVAGTKTGGCIGGNGEMQS
jgi:hypothetical protein